MLGDPVINQGLPLLDIVLQFMNGILLSLQQKLTRNLSTLRLPVPLAAGNLSGL